MGMAAFEKLPDYVERIKQVLAGLVTIVGEIEQKNEKSLSSGK